MENFNAPMTPQEMADAQAKDRAEREARDKFAQDNQTPQNVHAMPSKTPGFERGGDGINVIDLDAEMGNIESLPNQAESEETKEHPDLPMAA